MFGRLCCVVKVNPYKPRSFPQGLKVCGGTSLSLRSVFDFFDVKIRLLPRPVSCAELVSLHILLKFLGRVESENCSACLTLIPLNPDAVLQSWVMH